MAILSAEVFKSDLVARRTTLIVADNNLLMLDATTFSDDRSIDQAATQIAKAAYNHVRSGQSPQWRGKRACTLTVTVYHPIDDAQSKALNDMRATNGRRFASAVAGLTVIATKSALASMAVGFVAHEQALEELRSWDSGDVLIRVEASVSGGIGPQNHLRSVVIKRSAYDPLAQAG